LAQTARSLLGRWQLQPGTGPTACGVVDPSETFAGPSNGAGSAMQQ